MKRLLSLLLCLVIPMTAFAADNTYKVAYDGGSLPDIKAGKNVKLSIEQTNIRLIADKADLVQIPPPSITRSPTARMSTGASVLLSVSRSSRWA